MQMLKKLFKSKDKYYLELDEIKDSQVVQAVVNTAKDVVDVVQEKTAEIAESKPIQEAIKTAKEKTAEIAEAKPVQEAIKTAKEKTAEIAESKPIQEAIKTAKEKTAEIAESKPVQEAVKTAKEAKDTAQEKLQTVTTQEVKGKKGKAKKKGKQVTAKSQETTEAQPKVTPQNGASSYDPPFWVAAMYKNNSNDGNSITGNVEKTFATDNLMPTITQYRRRPGPSLNKFRDMAKASRFTK